MSLLKCIDTQKVQILETQKQQWTMEVANISPAIFFKFEHNMLLLYIRYFLNISWYFLIFIPTIKPNTILSHKGDTREN